ncbi:MAG: thioredoxin [Bdellovibrionaceae bacterium]|jgi:thioredoxin 1|nr:thioredoxin [Pseudobdellovibrionaceae bacterium]
MALMDLNDANFKSTLEGNGIIIIDFWAPWCGPCQSFKPIFEKAAEKYPEVVFGKVNTEDEQKLAMHFSIRSIPTIMVIRDQIEVFFQPGVLQEAQLHELVNKVKELDMEEVKKKVAEEEAAAEQ